MTIDEIQIMRFEDKILEKDELYKIERMKYLKSKEAYFKRKLRDVRCKMTRLKHKGA